MSAAYGDFNREETCYAYGDYNGIGSFLKKVGKGLAKVVAAPVKVTGKIVKGTAIGVKKVVKSKPFRYVAGVAATVATGGLLAPVLAPVVGASAAGIAAGLSVAGGKKVAKKALGIKGPKTTLKQKAKKTVVNRGIGTGLKAGFKALI